MIASTLERVWGGAETLIVVSSDLSHYLNYEAAQKIDLQTCHAIEEMAPDRIQDHGACGRFPVKGLLHVAKKRNMTVKTLDLRNSGDTAGPKNKVVGYGSWVLFEPTKITKTSDVLKPTVSPQKTNNHTSRKELKKYDNSFEAETRQLLDIHGKTLIRLAAKSISIGLNRGLIAKVDLRSFPPILRKNGASFVTLKLMGNLRGCIGSFQMYQPLAIDVANNAFKAAFSDPRFPSLTRDEQLNLTLSISVLSPQTPIEIKDEPDLLSKLRPQKDGLIIQEGQKRALFLPSVWEQLPDAKTFLHHLKLKAGIKSGQRLNQLKAWRFVTEEISSLELKDGLPLWVD